MSPLFFSPPPNFHNTLLSLQGNELPVVSDAPPEPPAPTSISRELIDRIVIIFEAAYFCFRAALYEPCFFLAHAVVTIIKIPVFLSILAFNGFSHLLGKDGYANVDLQEPFLGMHLHAIKIVQYTFSALTFLFVGIPFSPMKARLFKHHDIKLEDYKVALQVIEEIPEQSPPATPRSPSRAALTQDAETNTDYLFSDFPDANYLTIENEQINEQNIEANEAGDCPSTPGETELYSTTEQNPTYTAASRKEGTIDLTCIDTYRKYYIKDQIEKLKVERKQNKTNNVNNHNVEPATQSKTALQPRGLNFIFSPQTHRYGTPGSLPSSTVMISGLSGLNGTPTSYSMTPFKPIIEETTVLNTTIPDSITTPTPMERSSISSISQSGPLLSPPSADSLAKQELIQQLKNLRSIRFADGSPSPLFLPPEFISVADFQKAVFANGIRPRPTKEQIAALKRLPEQAPLPAGEQINFKNDQIEKIQYYYDLLVPLILKYEILKYDITSTTWKTVEELKEVLNMKIRWRFYQLSLKELETADEDVFRFNYAYQDVAIIRFLSQLKEAPDLKETNFYLPNLETPETS